MCPPFKIIMAHENEEEQTCGTVPVFFDSLRKEPSLTRTWSSALACTRPKSSLLYEGPHC